jgi:hypothetical protein
MGGISLLDFGSKDGLDREDCTGWTTTKDAPIKLHISGFASQMMLTSPELSAARRYMSILCMIHQKPPVLFMQGLPTDVTRRRSQSARSSQHFVELNHHQLANLRDVLASWCGL